MLGVETGDKGRKHPGREPSNPPVETDTETQSTQAQVAEFRSPRTVISLPVVVITALITAMSGAVVAWINKPPAPAVSALTPTQSAQLEQCAGLARDVAELKNTVRWIEPQIGILLVRTDSRAYSPPPRAP